MKVQIKKQDNYTYEDVIKAASFISPELLSVELNEDELLFYFSDSISEDQAREKTKKMFSRYFNTYSSSDTIQKVEANILKYHNDSEIKDVFVNEDLGRIALQGVSVKLFNSIERFINKEFSVFFPESRIYTAVIKKETLQKVKYFQKSPQVSISCSHVIEDISNLDEISKKENIQKNNVSEIDYVLSPAACFSLFEELENKTIKSTASYSFCQNVHRYEGRLSWGMPGRFSSYHVHELVFFGNQEYIDQGLEKVAKICIKLLQYVGLNGELKFASDCFVLPNMSLYERFQKSTHVKRELVAHYSENGAIAIGSLNLHHGLFSKAFNIKCENIDNTVSGCFGLGLERIIYCILKSYGSIESNWPQKLKDFVNEY